MINEREKGETELNMILDNEYDFLLQRKKTKNFKFDCTPNEIKEFFSRSLPVSNPVKKKPSNSILRLLEIDKYAKVDTVEERNMYLDQQYNGVVKILERMERKSFVKVKQLIDERSESKFSKEVRVLRTMDIIGMTSTGAAMRRKALNSIGAKIFIFEEIAELLEGQVIACVPSVGLEHLICIGDIFQLQPKFQCYDLKKHNIDKSLLERLMKPGLEHTTLNVQQRMRPEISNIITTCFKNEYPNLVDHENVSTLRNVPGMTSNVQFLDHERYEEVVGRSHVNLFEAEMVLSLALYLEKQKGYSFDDITILTPYKGQLFEIRRLMDDALKKRKGSFAVVTTDDYQGEENKVIILSLVRSKYENKSRTKSIGFLNIQNRIIVSLSRAKEGLYIVGNSKLMKEKSDHWKKVINLLKENDSIKEHFSCGCAKHPEMITEASNFNDFKRISHGGCSKPCNHRFECGHMCERLCHPTKHYCLKPCAQKMECGHYCKAICHYSKIHPLCNELVLHRFKDCGHSVNLKCHVDEDHVECGKDCGKTIKKCGHKCRNKCCDCDDCVCSKKLRDDCSKCKTQFSYICGSKICRNRCTKILPCGHRCSGTCGKCTNHEVCDEECSRKLLCGHDCDNPHPCSEKCKPCKKDCKIVCMHGIKCEKTCSDTCIPCREKCPNGCKHTGLCKNSCWKECSVKSCSHPCNAKFKKCGHITDYVVKSALGFVSLVIQRGKKIKNGNVLLLFKQVLR